MLNLANQTGTGNDAFVGTLAIGGISVVIFIISIYVPNIVQGVVQGVSVGSGMEVVKHAGQAASFAAGGATLAMGGARARAAGFSAARADGASFGAAALKAMTQGIGTGGALASAARDQAIGAPGSFGTSTLGLANTKLDQRVAQKKSTGKT